MFKDTKAFSGFAVDDLVAAKEFYGQKLGLEVEEANPGLRVKLAGGASVLIYSKEVHTPANYTILNFSVDDIEEAVKALADKGITLEQYEGMTDEKGIARGIAQKRGPDIAWFKDPAGNVLAVLQEG